MKVSDRAFMLTWDPPRRPGAFCAVAPYRCEACGPSWEETCWNRDGDVCWCPSCGRLEVHGPNQDGHMPCKVIRRYSIHRNPKYRGVV